MLGAFEHREVAVGGGVGTGVGEAFAWRIAVRGCRSRYGFGGGRGAEVGQELLLGGMEAVPQPCLGGEPATLGHGQVAAGRGGACPVVGALPRQGPGRIPMRVKGVQRGDPGRIGAPVSHAVSLA